ncbi:putative F-box domain, galactose oxidase/kelch, beta-propeller, F-box associated interaction [Helianthus annuus]|nr:putative F-box domain, galactose oxidase/kelch, beta-propeller, F-box associated interaction [Helianthus annuus]
MSNDLCDDLILNIFSKLPTKSLLRFRSVSKSLCVRIRTPSVFIRLHTFRSPEEKAMITHRLYRVRSSNDSIYTDVFAAGFDPVIDDYKILRITTTPTSYIYTMNTHTWREIASPNPTTPFTFVKYYQCLFQGTLHWVIKRYATNAHGLWYYITRFDLSSEVFSTIELPQPSSETSDVSLTVIKGCLAVFTSDHHDHCLWIRREYNNIYPATWHIAFRFITNPLEVEHRVLQMTPKDDLLYIVYPNRILVYNIVTGAVSSPEDLSDYPTSLDGMDMCLDSVGLLDMGTSCEGYCKLCKFRFYYNT